MTIQMPILPYLVAIEVPVVVGKYVTLCHKYVILNVVVLLNIMVIILNYLFHTKVHTLLF